MSPGIVTRCVVGEVIDFMALGAPEERRRRRAEGERRRRKSKRKARRSGPAFNPVVAVVFGVLLVASLVLVFAPGLVGQLREPGKALRSNPEWLAILCAVLLGIWLIPGVESSVLIRLGLRKPPRSHRPGSRRRKSSSGGAPGGAVGSGTSSGVLGDPVPASADVSVGSSSELVDSPASDGVGSADSGAAD